MSKFHKILESKETVLWEGKPRLLPYILDTIIPYIFIGTVWIALVSIFMIDKQHPVFDLAKMAFLLVPHFTFGVLLIVVPVIYCLFTHRHIIYMATDRRILIQSGLFGEDFESVEYDEIAQTKVDVGLRDLISGKSGTVFLHGKYRHASGGASNFLYTLHHVDNPYEVFKLIEKVSRDFKTEMKYPNKYRPRRNKGYKTKYKDGAAIET